MEAARRSEPSRGRTVFTFYPGMIRIPEGSTPDAKNRSYRVTAEVELPEGGAYSPNRKGYSRITQFDKLNRGFRLGNLNQLLENGFV